jgi:murein DD-endopeptidase MepM/ murein hydrolase activator NlpD
MIHTLCLPLPIPNGTDLARTSSMTKLVFLLLTWTLPVSNSLITRHYGPGKHPVSRQVVIHRGVDFAAPVGTPVLATRAGIVAESKVRNGYGNVLILDHLDGTRSVYAHLSDARKRLVIGQEVRAGQEIGKVGMTGFTTGPHLHFEVWVDGKSVDPMMMFQNELGPGVKGQVYSGIVNPLQRVNVVQGYAIRAAIN